jgi:agmatinase
VSFLAAGPPGSARGGLFGVPLDATVSFRPGSRFGPAAVRAASEVLEEWSLALGESLQEHPFCDLGDVVCAPGDVGGALAAARERTAEVLSGGLIPLVLGGEHLVTLPVLDAVADVHPGLAVVQMDAHADLRDDYLGQRLSHATVMRRVVERVGGGNVFQLGIRSATGEEAAYARAHTRFFPFEVAGPLAGLRDELVGRPVYVTIDVDVVDPAFAPGTGTPEPGGVSAAELLEAIGLLRGLRVVGLDVVEVAPAYDPGGVTAALAAKVLREGILVAC